MIIGVDPSLTSTGMAFLEFGKIRLQTIKGSGPDKAIEYRLHDLLYRINSAIRSSGQNPPELVVIEGIAMGSFGATTSVLQLAALHYILRMQLDATNIRFLIVPPTSLKKFVCGSGGNKVKKEHVLKAVYQRWGVDTESNDEADAAGLAYIGAAYTGAVELSGKAQSEVLAQLMAGPAPKKQRKMRNRAEMA